jgi:hypothetical protein
MTLLEEFQLLVSQWRISLDQLAILTGMTEDGVEELLALKTQPPGTIPSGWEGVAALVSIRKRLLQVFPKPEDQVEWLLRPNPDFAERAPLDFAAKDLRSLQWLSYFLETRVSRGLQL